MMVVMRDAPGKFKMIGGVSDITAYFGMAFRKEDGALRDFVNTQLAEMKKDGTLAKLQDEVVRRHHGDPEHGAGGAAELIASSWVASTGVPSGMPCPYMLRGALVTLEISFWAMALATARRRDAWG